MQPLVSNIFASAWYGILFVYPLSSITGKVEDGVRKVTNVLECGETSSVMSKPVRGPYLSIQAFCDTIFCTVKFSFLLSVAVDIAIIIIIIIVIFSIFIMKARRPVAIAKCYTKMRAGFKTIYYETYVVF